MLDAGYTAAGTGDVRAESRLDLGREFLGAALRLGLEHEPGLHVRLLDEGAGPGSSRGSTVLMESALDAAETCGSLDRMGRAILQVRVRCDEAVPAAWDEWSLISAARSIRTSAIWRSRILSTMSGKGNIQVLAGRRASVEVPDQLSKYYATCGRPHTMLTGGPLRRRTGSQRCVRAQPSLPKGASALTQREARRRDDSLCRAASFGTAMRSASRIKTRATTT